AHVALAGFGIARDDAWQRDKASGIFGPALEDGKPIERKVVFADDFFARAGAHCFRKKLSHFCENGEHLYFVEKTLRGFDVHVVTDTVGNLIQRVDFECQIHAAGGAKLIDQNLMTGMAFDVLEEQSRAASVPTLCRRREGRGIRKLASFARPGRVRDPAPRELW